MILGLKGFGLEEDEAAERGLRREKRKARRLIWYEMVSFSTINYEVSSYYSDVNKSEQLHICPLFVKFNKILLRIKCAVDFSQT